jgi:DNA-binding transcriptional MerR regulator
MNEKWRIDQLTEIVAEAVQTVGADTVASARIQPVPDLRAIRYYTHIGILDRPSELVGRTAYYERRHVHQMVAIKQLQSQGLTLREVQEQLLGASNTQLARISKIAATFWTDRIPSLLKKAGLSDTSKPLKKSKTRSDDFWSQTPSPPKTPLGIPPNDTSLRNQSQGPRVQQNLRIEIAPGVTLLLDNVDPSQIDLSKSGRLREAMDMFLKQLQESKLVPTSQKESSP